MAKSFSMDSADFQQAYQRLIHIAYHIIKPHLDKFEYVEGNVLSSNEFIPKLYNLFVAARSAPSGHILEIGFNAGFSTIIMLLANPAVHVTAIDICEHSYVKWCVNVVQELFPNRITFIEGDSKRVFPGDCWHSYDVIHIDGDHSYEGAANDLQNALAAAPAIVILDDTDIPHIAQLWHDTVSSGKIRCVADTESSMYMYVATPFHAIGHVV